MTNRVKTVPSRRNPSATPRRRCRDREPATTIDLTGHVSGRSTDRNAGSSGGPLRRARSIRSSVIRAADPLVEATSKRRHGLRSVATGRACRDTEDGRDLLIREVRPVAKVDDVPLPDRQAIHFRPDRDPIRGIAGCLAAAHRQALAKPVHPTTETMLVHCKAIDRSIGPTSRTGDDRPASQLRPQSQQDLLNRVGRLHVRQALPADEPEHCLAVSSRQLDHDRPTGGAGGVGSLDVAHRDGQQVDRPKRPVTCQSRSSPVRREHSRRASMRTPGPPAVHEARAAHSAARPARLSCGPPMNVTPVASNAIRPASRRIMP